MFELKLAFIPKDVWCVYAHYDLHENLAYIGMGAPHRAMTRERRTQKWHNTLGDGFYVSILSWHGSKSECEAAEAKLIRELKPPCNLIHTGRAHPSVFGNRWNVGRRHTPEAKLIMSQKQKESWKSKKRKPGSVKPRRPIKCIETGVIYDGLRETARRTGLCPSSISLVINGHRNHAGGFTFTRRT